MIQPKTVRWSQAEIASLVSAHAKGELATEEGLLAWARAHQREPRSIFAKLVEIGIEKKPATKGEIAPLSDRELLDEVQRRLMAHGATEERAKSLRDMLAMLLT